MAIESEQPQRPGWVKLFSPESDLLLNDDFFVGERVRMEPFGKGQMIGTRKFAYSKNAEGVSTYKGRMQLANAEEFVKNNYYDLSVRIHDIELSEKELAQPWVCEVALPGTDDVLQSKILVFADQLGNPNNQKALATSWRRLWAENKVPYRLFVPPDPSFLSELKFSIIKPISSELL
jgi:hypothetical protein